MPDPLLLPSPAPSSSSLLLSPSRPTLTLTFTLSLPHPFPPAPFPHPYLYPPVSLLCQVQSSKYTDDKCTVRHADETEPRRADATRRHRSASSPSPPPPPPTPASTPQPGPQPSASSLASATPSPSLSRPLSLIIVLLHPPHPSPSLRLPQPSPSQPHTAGGGGTSPHATLPVTPFSNCQRHSHRGRVCIDTCNAHITATAIPPRRHPPNTSPRPHAQSARLLRQRAGPGGDRGGDADLRAAHREPAAHRLLRAAVRDPAGDH